MSNGLDIFGQVEWLWQRMPQRNWVTLVSGGPEERCLAFPRWLSARIRSKANIVCVTIMDEASRFSLEAAERCRRIHGELQRDCNVLRSDVGKILDGYSNWTELLGQVAATGSVVIDISGLPKRFFLFAVKFFIEHARVRDLIVVYSRPDFYPEGMLSEAALPSSFIPGFARISSSPDESLFVVGVGYVAFNLEELLEQKRGKVIKFIMPFPPASPATRRNWNLLRRLHPQAGLDTEIRRVASNDVFEVLRWIKMIADGFDGAIDLIPLGPKSHAVAMAMAYLSIGDRCQVTYAQPTVYRPDYSVGIGQLPDGRLNSTAFCLKWSGERRF